MRRLAFAFLFVVASLDAAALFGQELLFSFSQERETYTWGDSLIWQPDFGGRKQFLFSNTSNTTLIRESILLESRDRWRENYRSRFQWYWKQGAKFSVSPQFENYYSSLEERIVVDNSVGVAVNYKPVPCLTLENIGSFITTARNNSGDKHRASGYQNQFSAGYNHRFSRATAVSIDCKQDMKTIRDIPTASITSRTSFFSLGLNDSVRVSLAGEYQRNRYFTTTQSYESISIQKISTAGANLTVSYRPMSQTRIRLLANFDFRQFRYEHYGIEGSKISSGLLGSNNSSRIIDYKLSASRDVARRIVFDAHYIYREIGEDYGALSAKQNVKTGELRFAMRSSPGINDSIWAETIFSVTGYFSDRSSSFFSDRDRIMQLFGLGFKHRFSRCLTLRVDGSYRDFHQTYVSGALSANNNHNSVYVVKPEVDWMLFPWFVVSNSFLLHANYIWYDHEKKIGSERNTLFRRAQGKSECRLVVSRRLKLKPAYTYRYEDFGQLLWRDQWVQKTNWYRRTHLPSMELTYQPVNGLRIESGISYEWKKSWEFTVGEEGVVDRIEKETFRRTTVHLNVDYSPSARTNIRLSMLRRVQKSDLFTDDTSNQYIINVYRRF